MRCASIPSVQGLLFAGTEKGVYVSFDDGAQWQPLQLNLPVAPVNDLMVKNDDLVVATHGRSFWVLDDITPLRSTTIRFRSRKRICSRRPANETISASFFGGQGKSERTLRPERSLITG